MKNRGVQIFDLISPYTDNRVNTQWLVKNSRNAGAYFGHMGRKKMSIGLSLTELIEYTDWERGKWHDWLRKHGDSALAISAGPHGNGRFQTVGDQVRHIFSAEKRYKALC
jgi:hypothetical protein